MSDRQAGLRGNGAEHDEAAPGAPAASARIVEEDPAVELRRDRAVLAHMQHGFALCRMVWEAERPVDFVVVDTNLAFERLTGLRGAVVRGRRITDVLPGVREDPVNWLEWFGAVVRTGKPVRLRRFAAPLGRFYALDIFRPEPGHFAVIFDEVTDEQRADEARRAAVAELQAVLDAVPAVVFITRDRDARRIEGNRVARELLRCPADANLSLTAPEDERPRHFRATRGGVEVSPDELPVQFAAARGVPLRDVSIDFVFEDGTTRRMFGNVAPLHDADGAPAGAVAAFLDETERQRAAERIALLQRVNERLAAAMTPAEVADVVFHDGLALMGAKGVVVRPLLPDGTLGVLRVIGMPPHFVETLRRAEQKGDSPGTDAVRTGRPVWLGSPEVMRARYPFLAAIPSGAWAALPLKAGGRTTGAVGISFTAPQGFPEEDRNFMLVLANKCARALERALMYEENRRQRVLLDTLFAVDPGGIAIVADRPGDEPRFVMANPAYRALVPDPSLDPVGRTVEEVWPSAALGQSSTEGIRRQMQAGTGTGQQTVGSGSAARHLIWNTRRIPWNDGTAVVVLLWDITKLHELQEQREDMLRMISHDLRTPLNALVLHAGMLQRAFDPSDSRASRTSKIIANAMRMDGMIRELVEMTQLEGGQVALARAPVHFGEYARQVVERLEDGDRIRVAIPDELPPVSIDRDRFERVLVNLLDNALKYSPPSEPVLLSVEAAPGGVAVAITDRGPGIAKEDLARVFDRYFRTKDARRKDGLGLGLYITSLLVRAHGGRIEVESVPGAGATFRVFLPSA